jgi:hypothetical protein
MTFILIVNPLFLQKLQKIMEEKFDYKDYNWVYYVIGIVFGCLTGWAVEGNVIIGAILGLLTGGLVQFLIGKSREQEV